jgi:outer membrane protein
MKNLFRTILPVLLLMTFMGGSALAQTKIATVDLRKLFDNYYKTKLAQAQIQEHAAQLDNDDKSMKNDLKKASDDYQTLLQQSSDQALSADERDRRKQAASDKLKELQSNKAAIDQYERQAQTTLGEQRQRMREKIIIEIKAAVTTKAKTGGYTLVFDTAAETVNGTMAIVYTSGDNDLTDAVLAQLNAGAPIDTTNPVTTTPPPLTNGTGNP